MSASVRQLRDILRILVVLTIIGMVGFRIFSGAPWIDCLYMAVITLSTVGYGEAVPLEAAGKVFVIVYIVVGILVFAYQTAVIAQWVVSDELRSFMEKRRMARQIAALDQHFIVCGLGRVGRSICDYLDTRNQPFLVIDNNEEMLKAVCHAEDWFYVVGDATDDAVLREARIEHAKSLASVLPTDADNIYVVLSARMINTNLQIIARTTDDRAVEKMERAGANRVISPLMTSGIKMARFMLNPSLDDFIEIADSQGNDLELADVQIEPDSKLVGQQLSQTGLGRQGVMVIGIRREDGERLMPPPGDTMIMAGDSLFAFGPTESVNRMLREAV